MYEEIFGHFGLARNPFLVSPDPENFHSTAAHDEALLQLVSRIEARQGLLVLTGEAGTGKTIVLRYLLDWLRKYRYSTAFVFHPLLRSADLLELIVQDFGIVCFSSRKRDLRIALKNWLIDRHKDGECPVILIDEAQALKAQALAELHALLNLQIEGARLVQVVLAGQPTLEEKLAQQNFAGVVRVMYQCTLSPLSVSETAAYIASRLSTAGAIDTTLIPQESLLDIYRYSKGIPRVINLLCEHTFLAAYADRRQSINPEDVLRVAQYFDLCGASASIAETVSAGGYCCLIPFPRQELAAIEQRTSAAQTVVETVVSLEFATNVTAQAAVSSVASVEAVEESDMLQRFEGAVAVADVPAAEYTVAVPQHMLPGPEQTAEPELHVEPAHVWKLLPEFAASINLAATAAREEETRRTLEPDTAISNAEPEPVEFEPAAIRIEEVGGAAPLAVTVAVAPELAPIVAAEVLAAPEPVVVVTPTAVEPPKAPSSVLTASEAPLVVAPPPVPEAKPVPAPVVKAPVKVRPAVVAVTRSATVNQKKIRPSPTRFAAPQRRAAVQSMVRIKKRFVDYWRGVGRSFVRDSRAFARHCSLWLQKPIDGKGISAVSRRAVVAASAWLRHPIH
jgi:general secretion pathway protein A